MTGVAPDLVIVLLQLRSVVRVVRCESERDSDTACDSEAGLVCNSAKLTGGDDLQTWSRIPESCFTRNGCYCCNRKKNAFLYTRTGFSGTDHILN